MNKEQFKQWQEENKDFLLGKSFTNGISLYKIINQPYYDMDDELYELLNQHANIIVGTVNEYEFNEKSLINIIDICPLDELVSEWLGENEDA